MDDKIVMNTTLTLVKNICELLLHGLIESSTKSVKTTFIESLDTYLKMHGEIFTEMKLQGLNKAGNATELKLKKLLTNMR